MQENTDQCCSGLRALTGLLAIPVNLIAGLIAGLALPLAAVAGIVLLVRLVTGRFPFPVQIAQDEAGERQVTLALVEPGRIPELWEAQKAPLVGGILQLKDEMQAISQGAQSQ